MRIYYTDNDDNVYMKEFGEYFTRCNTTIYKTGSNHLYVASKHFKPTYNRWERVSISKAIEAQLTEVDIDDYKFVDMI